MRKRFIKPVLYSLVIALVLLVASSSALAQLQPPISPWMGMMDRTRSPSGLDNYHRIVKPQQDLMKAYAAQQGQMAAQAQALEALQSGSGSGGVGPRDLVGTGGGVSTGAGGNMLLSAPRELPSTQRNPAGFYQYLHYYPPNSLQRRQVPYFSSTGGRR